jgi:ComEC/Rec2-related protein
MKQPLTVVAMVYACGVLAGRLFPSSLPLLFGSAAAVFLLAVAIPSRREVGLWGLLLLTGWTNLTWRTAVISPHDLRDQVGDETVLATIQGTLIETPSERVFPREGGDAWRTLAVLEAKAIRRTSNLQPAAGLVRVRTPGQLGSEFYAGRAVEVAGVLGPPRGPLAEGLFDYRRYLAWQGVYYQLQTEGPQDWRLLPDRIGSAKPPLSDRFQNWAQRTLARGLPVEDEELHLLWAMALGWKTALSGEVSAPFMQSGTMHIFAISGLHIALIATILTQVLRLLQVPRCACGLVVIPLIWFYTAATGWQASAIRSTIMMTVVIAGYALARPRNLLNSLAASGLIILIWDPRQLFQASFQLSFFVVLSIALMMPPFQKLSQRLLRPDPFLPEELRSRWQRVWHKTILWLATSFVTSLAAWLGSLPLIALYFHLVTPVSLLANLVVVPLSSLSLMCNLGSLMCGAWCPWLTELFNHSAWFWMHSIVRLSNWFVRLPGAYFYVPSPPAWGFVVYYSLLLTAPSGWSLRPGWRPWTAGGPVVLCLAALVLAIGECRVVRLTIIPLSGGHAVYVDRLGRSRDLLVDCGDERTASYVLTPCLHAQGVNRLANLALTHGDLHHVGGTELVRREFAVSQVTVSSAQFRSAAYRRVIDGLVGTPEALRRIQAGDEIAGWQVLHPQNGDRFAQADDLSLVLASTIHGTRVLLLGDLGPGGQRRLLERCPDLQADIVVSGLPQLGEPLGDAFLDRVQPSLIILCTSEYPTAARGTPHLRERLARRRSSFLCTGESGAASLRLSSSGCQVRTVGGTITMPLSGHGTR